MPIKVEISLDAGHGGESLSGFWIARCDSIRPEKKNYTYQVSAKIHPWKTLTQFTHVRDHGHLLLVSAAITALHEEGYRAVHSVKYEAHDTDRIATFRLLREDSDLDVNPADFL